MSTIILRYWRQAPGKYFCISTKTKSGKWKDNFFTKDEFDEIEEFIQENSDKDLYWCIRGLNEKRRVNGSIAPTYYLYADLDKLDPRELELKPTAAWESSPGRYAGLWKLDKPYEETDDINETFNKKIGADRSSWIATKVLRIPGTVNYKPEYNKGKGVPGRFLWGNGPTYERDKITSQFGSIRKANKGNTSKSTGGELVAADVYKQYENKIKPKTRQDLRATDATKGKRSEVLWRIWIDLLDAGMTTEEAICVVKPTVWNKWSGKSREDEQLYREVNKVIEDRLEGTLKRKGDDDEDYSDEHYNTVLTKLSDVEAINVDWVVPGMLARGQLTTFEGDPGIGKSYFVQTLGIHIVDGMKFPLSRRRYPTEPEKGVVLWFDFENDIAMVTKPRLEDNNCENMDRFIQTSEIINLDEEESVNYMEGIIKFIVRTMGRLDLVVFDTINTYMGKNDTHKASDVQKSLGQLTRMARKYNFAVAIVRHLTKGGKDKIQYRGQGSIAFMGMSRQVHTVAHHPREDDTLVIKTTKSNLGRPEKPLTFRLEELPRTPGREERSRLVLGDHDDSVTDQELNQGAKKEDKANQEKERQHAKEVVQRALRKGDWVEKRKVLSQAEAASVNEKLVERAVTDLEVEKKIEGRTAFWRLRK